MVLWRAISQPVSIQFAMVVTVSKTSRLHRCQVPNMLLSIGDCMHNVKDVVMMWMSNAQHVLNLFAMVTVV